jgi:hypothetical protein
MSNTVGVELVLLGGSTIFPLLGLLSQPPPDLHGGLVVFILSVCGIFPLFAVFCHHHCGGGSMGGGGLGSAVLGFLLFRFPLLVCFANVLF